MLSLLRMEPFLEASGFQFVESMENMVRLSEKGMDFQGETDSVVEWMAALGPVEDAVTAEGVCAYGSQFILKLANVGIGESYTRSQEMEFASRDFWALCDAAVNRGDGFLRSEYRDIHYNLSAIELMWQERDFEILSVDSSWAAFGERVNKVRSGMEKRRRFAVMVAECGGWG